MTVAPGDIVDCAVYIDGARLWDRCTYKNALAEVRERNDGFVWLGLHEPSAALMTDVAETFGLHPLAAEDAVKGHQRPKLERYENRVLVLVLRTVRYHEHELNTVSEIVDTG